MHKLHEEISFFMKKGEFSTWQETHGPPVLASTPAVGAGVFRWGRNICDTLGGSCYVG